MSSSLTTILDRLEKDVPNRDDLATLLGLSRPEDTRVLFQAARRARDRYFGRQVFFYGFLYFSTFCRNDCRFCQYRSSNKMLPRYRKTQAQILEAAKEMADAGVHLIDLTMGEDPLLFSSQEKDQKALVSMVKEVRQTTGLPVMISPGAVPDRLLSAMARADADWYACYQETHNKALFARLRAGQDFETRLNKKQAARDFGMLIEEGILTGVGESLKDIADSILWMRDFKVDQARVMTFVPHPDTPMGTAPFQDSQKEQIIIAVMRLVLKDVLIPATLDVDGLSGLRVRLDAGANVVTSIVPPDKGLAGVANQSLDIEDSRRTLNHILPVLKDCGLEPAEQKGYQAWISQRQMKN